MAGATLRIRDEPFFITGRGVVIVGDLVAGTLRYGPHAATVTIPGGPEGNHVEPVDYVEAAHGLDRKDGPALLFRAERGEREKMLVALLRPGTLLSLTGPATEPGEPGSSRVQVVTERDEVIAATATLARDFRNAGVVSAVEMARRSGFAAHRGAITVDDIARYLAARPELVEGWELWSMDKRTDEGWFFFRRDWKLPWQGRWVVGYRPRGAGPTNVLQFDDRHEACATFVLRELEQLTKPRG